MSSPSFAPGGAFGRFQIDGKIGAGGMGEVYRATDLRLGRTVALKVLPTDVAGDASRRARFEKESRAAAALNHPNIVTVYDAGVEGEVPWIAMELVEGTTLRRLLSDGPLSAQQIIDIAIPVADALAKAHENGIVHRDLKPENIMITAEGTPKVLDFGLARMAPKVTDETQSVTALDGAVAGTVGYMAPEQLLGRPADHRADQFALGTVLFELSKGENPFRRDTGAQTIAAILEMTPRLDTGPRRLAELVNRCLEKDPGRRYQSTRELASELKLLRQPVSAAAPAGRRLRAPLVAAALIVLAAVTGVGLWKARDRMFPSKPRVLAIRTFQNVSGNPQYDYYAGTITDEIRSQMSLVAAVRPLARSAVDRYKDGELGKLRTELGASHVLEGTVAPAREKLHVVLQVREAGSLKTVWSREYDRASGDLATLRGAVSMDVAGAIGARITAAERGRLERVPTKNREAYDLFLQARRARAMLSRDSMARTISLLKQAVELDPRFAEAMASISYLLMLGNDPRNVQEALDWAQKALAVDADSAAAHQSLATAFGNKGAFTKSRAEFKRAIEINPNDTVTLNNYSVLEAQLGHFEESLQLARRGLELNPYFTEAYFHVSIPLQFLASREQVSKWLELWRVRFPRAYRVPMAQLLFEVSGGNYQGALDGARKILETYKGNPEIELLVSDLAMVCGAPDAEEILRRVSNGALDPAYLQFMILPESPRARLAWFLLKRGDKAGAEKMLADAERVAMEHWRSGVQAPGLPVELAAIHAMRGDGNEAANWYQRAFDAGWRERLHEKLDPMLIPAASHPRFRAVVQQIEEDVRRKAAESREVKALFEETVPTLPPPPVKK